jgi:ABC-type branched-subunit amino acid transport system permease subunit
MSGETSVSERLRFLLPVAGAVAVAVLLPFGWGYSNYALDLVTVALIYAMFTVSWELFCGATGELSFGHTFFVGTAAYATALLQSSLGIPPLAAVLSGTLAGAAAGALVGLLTLRHSGAVFTLVTMALQLSFHRTLFLWSNFFGGGEGVFIGESWVRGAPQRYALVAFLSIASLGIALLLRETSFGRQLRASGGDVRVGLACGVRVPFVRTLGSTLSGLIAGLAGSALAMQNMVANPELAGDMTAGLIFLLAMLGGFGSLVGAWLAAVIYLAVVREGLVSLGSAEPMVAFGLLFLAIWAMPEGVSGVLSRWKLRWKWAGQLQKARGLRAKP